MRWHLIPGINVWNFNGSIGRWQRHIEEQFNVEVIPHPSFRPFGTAWILNPREVRKIANTVLADDVLIGHSDAADIIHDINKKRRFKGAVLLHAALYRDARFNNVDWVHNWYHPKDLVISLSKYIPFKDWGRLGERGFSHDLPNHKDFKITAYSPKVRSHSDIFSKSHSKDWVDHVGKQIFFDCGITIT